MVDQELVCLIQETLVTRSGFFDLGNIDILGQVILLCGVPSCALQDFSRILTFSTPWPQLWQPKMSVDTVKSPLEGIKSPCLRITVPEITAFSETFQCSLFFFLPIIYYKKISNFILALDQIISVCQFTWWQRYYAQPILSLHTNRKILCSALSVALQWPAKHGPTLDACRLQFEVPARASSDQNSKCQGFLPHANTNHTLSLVIIIFLNLRISGDLGLWVMTTEP